MAEETGSQHFRGPTAEHDVNTQIGLAGRVVAEVVEIVVGVQRKQPRNKFVGVGDLTSLNLT
jgi:hypothetical protein